jgi:hypothetical protein
LKGHTPLQYTRLNLFLDTGSLPVGSGGTRRRRSGRRRIIHIQIDNFIGLGTLGNVHNHHHSHTEDDDQSNARIDAKPPVFVERRFGIGIILHGGIDEFILGGSIHSHGHGQSILGEETPLLGIFGDGTGNDFIVGIIGIGCNYLDCGFVGEFGLARFDGEGDVFFIVGFSFSTAGLFLLVLLFCRMLGWGLVR